MPIPYQGDAINALFQGTQSGTNLINAMMNKRAQDMNAALMPYRELLMKGQAASSIANAQKAQAWANLINNARGSGVQPSMQSGPFVQPSVTPGAHATSHVQAPIGDNFYSTPQQDSGIQPPSSQSLLSQPLGSEQQQKQPVLSALPNEQEIVPGNTRLRGFDRIAGLAGIPAVQSHYDTDGNLVKIYPSGRVTRMRVGMSAMQQALTKQDAKDLGTLNQSMLALSDQQPIVRQLKESVESPIVKNMLTSNIAPALQVEYYKREGTPEQKQAIANMDAANSQLKILKAKMFKGAFREFEKGMLDDIAIHKNDPLATRVAKANMIYELSNLAMKRGNLINHLARQQGLSLPEAITKAQEILPGTNLEQQFNKISEKLTVPIKAPDGKIYEVPREQVDDALKAGGKRVEF